MERVEYLCCLSCWSVCLVDVLCGAQLSACGCAEAEAATSVVGLATSALGLATSSEWLSLLCCVLHKSMRPLT